MRRLTAHQDVEVILDRTSRGLDHEDDGIACMVAWVKGPVATLIYSGEVSPDVRGRLTAGSLAFLMFDHLGTPVALRGAVAAVSGSSILEFVVLDGVQIPERRITERVPLSIAVRVDTTMSGDPGTALIETVSADLSITGMRLERRSGLDNGPRWKIELAVPGGGPPICCGAIVARRTGTHIGVAFTDMKPVDNARLNRLLAEHERGSKAAA
jgi:hypothetical protein